MQTNFENFFFSNNNSEQIFADIATNSNSYNLNEHNSYRDIRNFYMDQFNQDYNNYNDNSNNNSICVSSSTERLVPNEFTSCIQNCEEYSSNNNNNNNKDYSTLEYWNLYPVPSNTIDKSTMLKAENLNDNNSKRLQDPLNGIYVYVF